VIDLQPLSHESSTVNACGYDAATQTLGVRFHSSAKVYLFAGVPPDVAEGLRTAESPGRYFAAQIKGRFQPPPAEGKPADQA